MKDDSPPVTDDSVRSSVRTDTPIPEPPFWGVRELDPDLDDVYPYLDRHVLFKLHWGGRGVKGEEWERLVAERLRSRGSSACGASRTTCTRRRGVGYFPCNADGNELVVYDPENPDVELERLIFPRQPKHDRICLADFFRPVDSGERDVVALQGVTVGPEVTELIEKLERDGEFAEQLFTHGLGVQTAEGLAEWLHAEVRSELGIDLDQGRRYSWGYPACPDQSEHEKVWRLLGLENIGMTLSDGYAVTPEQSTVAIIAHHPQAVYFGMKSGFVPKEKAPDELIAGTERGGEVPALRLASATIRAMAELAPGSVVAGYRIEGVLGRGGMGVVYRATQLSLDRPVALKVIAPELAGDVLFRERFKRESRIAASIEHPNVIPVYEAGEGDGLLFLTMRYVEGTDLRALLEADGTLEPARAARLLAQVAAALAAAHRRDLMHRDVKPANVLVDREDGREHAYLTDFGIARHVAATTALTATGSVVGTLDYLAPERIVEGGGDARADVYALGCVLFQVLTGSVPYPRDHDAAKMYAHLNAPVPDARELNKRVPDTLAELAMQAMAKEPDARVHSASELAERLVEAADTRESPVPATLPAKPPIPAAPATPPTEPAPSGPAPTDPAATEPAPTAPAPTEPAHRAAHRAGSDPAGTDRAGAHPARSASTTGIEGAALGGGCPAG